MRHRDERGFTLVELVIAMGMFTIVMFAIIYFLTSGTRSYGYAKNELNLQMESQMLLNQIRDVAYSSNYAEFDASNKALILYDVDKVAPPSPSPGATPTPSTPPYIKTAKVVLIYLIGDKLYLQRDLDPTAVDPAALSSTCVASDDYLFSRYMTDFDATVNKNDIQLIMKMKNGSRKYELNEGVTIRNGWVEYP
ncbi:MAG: type II secretion system protein [Lachnospiraceae bacterium]|nr:type II secretion system protein [Lachnospiraceae bacterium]